MPCFPRWLLFAGCGPFLDLELYQSLMNATGRNFLVENCHWGLTVPTLDWCPFSYFRTSYDISKNWPSVYANLQTLRPYQDRTQPLSRPGCWAYPDMLEVGHLHRDSTLVNATRTYPDMLKVGSSVLKQAARAL